MKPKPLLYSVESPDGIPINPQPYKTLEAAKAALDRFAKSFAVQGYYTTSNHRRIPLEAIAAACTIVVTH